MTEPLLFRLLLAELRELAVVYRTNATALKRDAKKKPREALECLTGADIWIRAAQGVERVIGENEVKVTA